MADVTTYNFGQPNSSLSASRLVATDSNSKLTSAALAENSLYVGNASSVPTATTAEVVAALRPPQRSQFVHSNAYVAYTSGGTFEITPGDVVTGATSSATAVVQALSLTSGAWASGTAAGTLYLINVSGTFEAENLNVGASTNVATIAGATTTRDTLIMKAGRYVHDGTVNQVVYCTTGLYFIYGAAGSNADSAAMGNNTWYYIYLDDSAIVTAASPILTAACLLANTTAPVWSDTKMGFYNGEDRCIFALKTETSATTVVGWNHDGGDYVGYAGGIVTNINNTDVDDVWTDCTLVIPGFGENQKSMATVRTVGAGGGPQYWRKKGSSSAGHVVGVTNADATDCVNTVTVYSNKDKAIQVVQTASSTQTMYVYSDGYYLPTGM